MGVVQPVKMKKTITVLWARQVKHPRYGKIMQRNTKAARARRKRRGQGRRSRRADVLPALEQDQELAAAAHRAQGPQRGRARGISLKPRKRGGAAYVSKPLIRM